MKEKQKLPDESVSRLSPARYRIYRIVTVPRIFAFIHSFISSSFVLVAGASAWSCTNVTNLPSQFSPRGTHSLPFISYDRSLDTNHLSFPTRIPCRVYHLRILI